MDSDPDAGTIMTQIMVLVLLTLVNAFFAGAEMAVVSVNKNKMKKLAEQGNKRAALIQKLSEDSTSFLSTIQVAITFAGFFSSASAATGISQVLAVQMKEAGIPYSQKIAVGFVTIILSYFTLVFGELVPKRIALQKAEWFSLFCVKPIYVISKIMAPFIRLLSFSTNIFLKCIGMSNGKLEEEVSEEEIKAMLETGSETGVFNEIEKDMITSIFSFDDKKARDVMVPRQDIVAVNILEPKSEYLDEILHSRHSRIPVYEADIDHIIGVLPMKDYMIAAKDSSFHEVDIKEMLQEPFFIPENRKIDELFVEMQREKKHMAILIDEYGGVSGLVTIEDLIEEIVGDIREEYEVEEPEIVALEDGTYQMAGSVLIMDLNDEFHLQIQSECDTLSGYLIEQLGYIPEEGQLPIVLETAHAKYSIKQVSERVIGKVQVSIHSKNALKQNANHSLDRKTDDNILGGSERVDEKNECAGQK